MEAVEREWRGRLAHQPGAMAAAAGSAGSAEASLLLRYERLERRYRDSIAAQAQANQRSREEHEHALAEMEQALAAALGSAGPGGQLAQDCLAQASDTDEASVADCGDDQEEPHPEGDAVMEATTALAQPLSGAAVAHVAEDLGAVGSQAAPAAGAGLPGSAQQRVPTSVTQLSRSEMWID